MTAILLDETSVPPRYRYRTAVLVGPWRSRSKEAEDDAVRARQARLDAAGEFRWSVDGSIEIGAEAAETEDPRGWSAH